MRCSKRLDWLRQAGAKTTPIHRARPTATVIWGSAVVGIPDARLNRLGVSALKAERRTPAGCSLGLRCKSYPGAARRDPLVVNVVDVAKKHAYLVWN